MTENIVTSKDTIRQERKERPPVFLVSAGSQVVENPSSTQIIDEIDMTVMAPVRVIYELVMADNGDENHFSEPKGIAAMANTLFTALERWERLARYL